MQCSSRGDAKQVDPAGTLGVNAFGGEFTAQRESDRFSRQEAGMSSEFILSREPDLRDPSLIIGLPDVGYVGLRVIDYLKSKVGTKEFGHIEPRRFSTVPWVSVKNGMIEDLELLRNGFSFWKNTSGGNDLVVFRSEQPTARPYEYVEAILDVAQHVGVRRVYIVGSFGAVGVTHEEPPGVLGVVNMAHLTELLVESGVQPYPQYKGIGTIHSAFLWFAKERCRTTSPGFLSPGATTPGLRSASSRGSMPWRDCGLTPGNW
jgi:proteasome assembly chaperone (PAC2) family protein